LFNKKTFFLFRSAQGPIWAAAQPGPLKDYGKSSQKSDRINNDERIKVIIESHMSKP
jgi:hypothetical protein